MNSTARKLNVNAVKTTRNSMIAAIQIEWKKWRKDLQFADEIREERLAWMTQILRLKRPLESMTKLTDGQLAIVLDEIRRQTRTPIVSSETARAVVQTFPAAKTNPKSADTSEIHEIIHLAGKEQVYTINKLWDFLAWTEEGKRSFLTKRFRRPDEKWLTYKQCNSLMMILLNTAANKDLRESGTTGKISRQMTAKQIPILKQKLGIDQKL